MYDIDNMDEICHTSSVSKLKINNNTNNSCLSYKLII